MQAFFRGTVVLLYFISHYFAEPIFIVACLLPIVYGLIVCAFLRFGGSGRLIAAKDRARKMVGKGVLSGERRALFFKKCIRGLSPEARVAYSLFAEGRATSAELASAFARSVKVRGELLKGGMTAVGFLSSLSVFLAFYFGASIGETLLRTAICAFLSALNGVALHFILYASLISAEKAAERLAAIVDGSLLREKREAAPFSPLFASGEGDDRPADATFQGLRSLLRDLDERERTRSSL